MFIICIKYCKFANTLNVIFMKKFFIVILTLALYATAWASSQEFLSVSGKVQDASNGRALGFASVHLLHTNISNVSNTDGIFVLKYPANTKADTLMISYLGYKSKRIALSDFNGKELKISLDQSIISLKPITIRPQDALSILKMAFSRVPDNYSSKPMQMTAFYREMIKKGSNYVAINEAVLDISKASYTNYKADQIGIYKARGNYDEYRIDTLLIKFQGGPNSAIDLDIVKDPFLGVEPMFLDQIYEFKFSEPVTLNDRLFYVIEFDEKVREKDIFFRGRVFIDAESFAIGRAEFAMNVEGREQANTYFVKRKPTSLRMDVISANYLVNFKPIAGQWFFDYSRTEVKFNAKWKRKWFSSNYTIMSEVAVTDILPIERKIEPQNRIRAKDIFSNKVNDFTDDNFWEDYNIIEPDQSIDKVISRIIKQLRKRQ